INALKPFIAVVRELAEITGLLLEPPAQEREEESPQSALANTDTKQTKRAGTVIEIVPNK
ncbi:MAG: hypothetical protein IJ799_02970, partial [Bacteroidales bacterium]|nr:hypothetical protein [Bacteroidales bacterium]